MKLRQGFVSNSSSSSFILSGHNLTSADVALRILSYSDTLDDIDQMAINRLLIKKEELVGYPIEISNNLVIPFARYVLVICQQIHFYKIEEDFRLVPLENLNKEFRNNYKTVDDFVYTISSKQNQWYFPYYDLFGRRIEGGSCSENHPDDLVITSDGKTVCLSCLMLEEIASENEEEYISSMIKFLENKGYIISKK